MSRKLHVKKDNVCCLYIFSLDHLTFATMPDTPGDNIISPYYFLRILKKLYIYIHNANSVPKGSILPPNIT